MWAVIASGQSLTLCQVVKCLKARDAGILKGIIAVSNVGIDLCPNADALVSHDGNWWARNPQASKFRGRKFCRNKRAGVEVFIPSDSKGCNSGLMAMEVAHQIFKAESLLLLGFDMHGTHYFGPHPEGLKNTGEAGFNRHISQFKNWRGCPVINCTPNSALKQFPFQKLEDVIQS